MCTQQRCCQKHGKATSGGQFCGRRYGTFQVRSSLGTCGTLQQSSCLIPCGLLCFPLCHQKWRPWQGALLPCLRPAESQTSPGEEAAAFAQGGKGWVGLTPGVSACRRCAWAVHTFRRVCILRILLLHCKSPQVLFP